MGKIVKLQTNSPRIQLRGALQRGELVRVWRAELEEGSFCGYLAGLGKEWLLMWVIGDQIAFDGLYAMRLADITEVEAPDSHHVFMEKALALRGIQPRLPRNFPLDDIVQIVRATADYAAVMCVHVDTEDEHEVCYIGRPLGVEDDGFTLQEITPDAEWLREPSFFGWDEVSTISFDEPYAQVLLDVAGQPPRIDFTGSGFGTVH
ncbi:MAG TPA: hypothetical protein VFQ95_07535 [Rhodanobacteraceae bacterium]|nr:hypothetical protein [Rhodanobacteraceae bacterium]